MKPDKIDEQLDLVIEPGRAEKNYWHDLWRYRELFYILSLRDIKVSSRLIPYQLSVLKDMILNPVGVLLL